MCIIFPCDMNLSLTILSTDENGRVVFVDPTEGAPSLNDLYSIHRPSITIIDRYVTPVWYVIGFPGNLLAFVVWIQPRMRPSSGCYLAALASADFLFLTLHLVFELQSAWEIRLLNVPFFCEIFPVFFLASQYLSPLLVTGFTVERYISVCHPFQREQYCNTRRATTVIACLAVFSLFLHIVQAYFWYYDPDSQECLVRQEVTANGIGSIWSVWSWITELIVFGLVPVSILVLNILVIVETKRMCANERKLLYRQPTSGAEKRRSHSKSTIPSNSATTAMLLAVSFYLIVTTLPATVAYVIYFSFPEGDFRLTEVEIKTDTRWQRHFAYWQTRTVVQELCMSHYAGNFLIYLTTGKIFRVELKRVIGRWVATMCKCLSTSDRGRGEYSYTRAETTSKINGAAVTAL